MSTDFTQAYDELLKYHQNTHTELMEFIENDEYRIYDIMLALIMIFNKEQTVPSLYIKLIKFLPLICSSTFDQQKKISGNIRALLAALDNRAIKYNLGNYMMQLDADNSDSMLMDNLKSFIYSSLTDKKTYKSKQIALLHYLNQVYNDYFSSIEHITQKHIGNKTTKLTVQKTGSEILFNSNLKHNVNIDPLLMESTVERAFPTITKNDSFSRTHLELKPKIKPVSHFERTRSNQLIAYILTNQLDEYIINPIANSIILFLECDLQEIGQFLVDFIFQEQKLIPRYSQLIPIFTKLIPHNIFKNILTRCVDCFKTDSNHIYLEIIDHLIAKGLIDLIDITELFTQESSQIISIVLKNLIDNGRIDIDDEQISHLSTSINDPTVLKEIYESIPSSPHLTNRRFSLCANDVDPITYEEFTENNAWPVNSPRNHCISPSTIRQWWTEKGPSRTILIDDNIWELWDVESPGTYFSTLFDYHGCNDGVPTCESLWNTQIKEQSVLSGSEIDVLINLVKVLLGFDVDGLQKFIIDKQGSLTPNQSKDFNNYHLIHNLRAKHSSKNPSWIPSSEPLNLGSSISDYYVQWREEAMYHFRSWLDDHPNVANLRFGDSSLLSYSNSCVDGHDCITMFGLNLRSKLSSLFGINVNPSFIPF